MREARGSAQYDETHTLTRVHSTHYSHHNNTTCIDHTSTSAGNVRQPVREPMYGHHTSPRTRHTHTTHQPLSSRTSLTTSCTIHLTLAHTSTRTVQPHTPFSTSVAAPLPHSPLAPTASLSHVIQGLQGRQEEEVSAHSPHPLLPCTATVHPTSDRTSTTGAVHTGSVSFFALSVTQLILRLRPPPNHPSASLTHPTAWLLHFTASHRPPHCALHFSRTLAAMTYSY